MYGVIRSLDKMVEPWHMQPFSRQWGAAIANFLGKPVISHLYSEKKVCMWRWRNSRTVNAWQNFFFRSPQMEKSSNLSASTQLRVNGKTAVAWTICSSKFLMQTDLTYLLLIALPRWLAMQVFGVEIVVFYAEVLLCCRWAPRLWVSPGP